jgi:hypothetical protein
MEEGKRKDERRDEVSKQVVVKRISFRRGFHVVSENYAEGY